MEGDAAERLFFELFSGLPRQGPGSPACTRRALALLPPPGAGARILDIGCGTGAQTLELARLTPAAITAVDLHAPFVGELNARAAAEGFGDRVRARAGDMARLEFPDGSFDLLWSEGAIYILGFDRGLAQWRRLLRPGGHAAVTEACWLAPGVPRECADWWASLYPAIRDVEANLRAAERAGWRVVGHFALPASAWWDDYYVPLERNLAAFRERHPGDPAADAVAGEAELEIAMFRRFSAYYGYVFFVLGV